MILRNFTNVSFPGIARQWVLPFWVLGFFVFGTQTSAVAGTIPEVNDNYSVKDLVVQASITGRVVDETASPLPGVNIIVRGTTSGTTTDADGRFTIAADDQAVLVFSFIGYVAQEVAVNGRSVIDVTLSTDMTQLDEVVVTALGIQRQPKELVYATQSIETKQLSEIRDPNNILNAFQGRIAGAVITQGSGGVGSAARIVLRGNRSIDGNNNALMVVDGIPIPGGNITSINPDDIESVTVLRGASAAALYGSQAGNGVIVITTKRGKEGQVSVTLNSGLTLESPFALPRVQNTYGQGSNGVLDPAVGNSWGPKMEGQTYTNIQGNERTYNAEPDNIKDFFRTGTSFHNSIGVSGGSEKMQTYLSYTNNKVQGIIPNNDLMSHTVNLRLSNQIGKRFSTDAKVSYFIQDIEHMPRSGEGNTPVLNAYQLSRNLSIEDAKNYQMTNAAGLLIRAPWAATLHPTYGNPFWSVNNDIHNQKTDNIIGFLSAKYEITDWLDVTGRANLDRSFVNAERKVYHNTLLHAGRYGGYYSNVDGVTTQKWFDVMLNGKNNLGENFTVDYHVGAIHQDNQTKTITGIGDGLNVANKFSLNFATVPQIVTAGSGVQTQSVFGQFNFGFKNSLFLEGSVRNDWDSRLQSPYAFQYYSLGSSAILSDLLTLPELFSFLKVNLSYAEVGNGGQFGLRTASYAYTPGVGNGYLSRSAILPFPDLKPEIVQSKEAGLEARILDNKFGVALTLYHSNSLNQLLGIDLPAGTGYAKKYINAGNIENKGLEVVLNASPVMNDQLEWTVDLNFGLNRSKVVKLSDDLKVVYLGGWLDFGGRPEIREGGSYGDIIANQWIRHDNGQYMVNATTGVPITTATAGKLPGVIGNFSPKANLGLTNTVTFKGFTLRALIDGRFGGTMVSGTEMNLAYSGITEGTEAYREGGWNLGGVNTAGEPVDVAITAQQFWQTASNKRSGVGEFFAYDITNFRLRELSLGYSIKVPDESFVKAIRLSLVSRNVLWLYRGSSIMNIPGMEKRKMWFDPDMAQGAGNTFLGVEYGSFPSTRSVGFDLNLTF